MLERRSGQDGIRPSGIGLVFVLFACWLLSVSVVRAADPQHRSLAFRSLPTEHSLIQNSVRRIVQDRRGFIWIATLGGLHRFDGGEMILINDLPDPSRSAFDIVSVSALALGLDDDLWVGGGVGGLVRIDGGDGSIESFSDLTRPLMPSNSNQVSSIAIDARGRALVMNGNALWRVDPEDRSITRLPIRFPDGWIARRIIRAVPLEGDSLLVQSLRGLGVLDPADGRIETIGLAGGGDLEHRGLVNLERVADGTLWVFGNRGFLAEIRDEGGELAIVPHALPTREDFTDICQDRHGDIWLQTHQGTLGRWSPGTGRFTPFEVELDELMFTDEGWLYCLLVDDSDSLWLGTEGYGVLQHDPSASRFSSMAGGCADDAGFWDPYIWDIKPSEAGIVLCGRGELGLMDPETHAYRRLLQTREDPRFADYGSLQGVAPLDRRRLLLGFRPHVLVVYDLEDGSVEVVYESIDSATGPSGTRILWSLEEDLDGDIWVLAQQGAYLVDRHTLETKPVPEPFARALTGTYPRVMLYRPDGAYLFGTENDGLIRVDEGATRDAPGPRLPTAEELPHPGIRGLHLQPNGDLWIGTYGGLAWLGGEAAPGGAPDLRIYTTADGLPNNTIYDILSCGDGTVWLSTNWGLSNFDRAAGVFHNYDVSDGLANNEFNGSASLLSDEGWAYFGGLDGLTWFPVDGDHYRNLVKPRAVVSRLVVGETDAVRVLETPAVDFVSIPWDRASLDLDVAALCYQQPGKQGVSYRIAEISSNWRNADRGQPIRFTNLPSGQLAFEYRVRNNDGIWSDTETLTLLVGTPPWRTPGAYLGYALVGLTVVWLAWLLYRRRRAEQEETARQLVLADKLNAVGQLAAGMAHDFNNQLQVIMGNTELLDLDLADDHPGRGTLAIIRRACGQAGLLTSRLLVYAKDTDPALKPIDLDETVAGLQEMISSFLGARIDLSFTRSPDAKIVQANREQLEQVVMNLCLNARDAITGPGRIDIRTSVSGSEAAGFWCVCVVEDDGAGAAERDRKLIFDPFYTTKAKGKGTGLGLTMADKIVKRHGGRMRVLDNERGGATFEFSLPLDRANLPATSPGPEDASSDEAVKGMVLVADDEKDVLEFTARILESAGYEVVAVKNGQEAIDALIDRPGIRLAVLDVVMPVKDGRAVYDFIQETERNVPVLFCSGFTFAALKTKEFRDLDVPVLAKPFGADELLEAVKALRSCPVG